MLSSAQLAAFQAAANAALDQSITVKRATRSQGATGHYTEGYSTEETVNGNLSREISSSLLQNYNYLISASKSWQVRLPVGTNVEANDRLIVGSQNFRVDVVLQPQSYQTSMLLIVSQLEGENI